VVLNTINAIQTPSFSDDIIYLYLVLIYHALLSFVDYTCRTDSRKCSDGLQCISEYNFCNRYTDCNDESDEDVEICKGKYTLEKTGSGINNGQLRDTDNTRYKNEDKQSKNTNQSTTNYMMKGAVLIVMEW
jgi:hypothetical protein